MVYIAKFQQQFQFRMYEIDESIDLYLVAQKFIQQEQDKIQNCGNEQAQPIKEDKKFEYSKNTIKNYLSPLKSNFILKFTKITKKYQILAQRNT